MSRLEDFVSAVEARTGQKAQKLASGFLLSYRPHPGSTPSVKVSLGSDGRILVHDHGGRETAEVLEAWGVRIEELFEGKATDVDSGPPIVLREHVFRNADGSENRTTRKTTKGWSQSWPGPDGGRLHRKPAGSTDVLYRLPELLVADPLEPILYTEGEKDAEALADLGLVATTNAQGAGKGTAEALKALHGRHVVLLLDNDAAGEEHSRKTHAVLTDVGAASVRVIRFPDLPPKGDVADAIAAGLTREGLLALIRGAEPYAGPQPAAPEPVARLAVTRMDRVVHRPTRWLWPGWLPLGKVVLLGGHPGDGKSSVLAELTALLSRGDELPDGYLPVGPMEVLWVLGEDGLEDTLWERLSCFGADLTRVHAATIVLSAAGEETWLDLAKHEAQIRQAIEETGARLLILDPITSFTGDADLNSATEVRRYLTLGQRIAEEREVTVLGVVHTSKPQAGTSRRAFQQVSGSFAWGAVARVVIVNGPHPDREIHPGTRVLAVAKSNLATVPPALMWSREQDGPIRWHGPTELSAEAVFGDEPVSPRLEAEEFLRDVLKGGSRPASEVQKEARDAGIKDRTLRRAREDLGIIWERENGKTTGRVWWRLPVATADGQHPAGGGHQPARPGAAPPAGRPPHAGGQKAGWHGGLEPDDDFEVLEF